VIRPLEQEIHNYSSQYSARLSTHTNGLIVNLIELPDNKTPAKWSAYQIPSVIVVFVILIFKFLFPKASRGFEPISYRGALLSTLLHATVYKFLHNLLNVLVQTANKMGLQKKNSSL
jgi:hypothetical protein